MYNEERKSRYIEIRQGTVVIKEDLLPRLFRMVGEVEDKLGKDACEFVENEILAFYKSIGTRSIYSLININSQFSTYTDWCLGQGYVNDGQNHYRVLSKEDFEGCLNLAAISILSLNREDLVTELRKLPNAREQFLILYIYEVGMEHIVENLKDMVMGWFEGNTLHLLDRNVKVSDELKSAAEKASLEDRIYSYENERSFPLNPDGRVVLWRNNANIAKISTTKFAIICRRAMDYVGYPKIRPKEIELMGMKHMFEVLAEERGMTTEEAILNKETFDMVMKQYGKNMRPNVFYNKVKGYL